MIKYNLFEEMKTNWTSSTRLEISIDEAKELILEALENRGDPVQTIIQETNTEDVTIEFNGGFCYDHHGN